MTDDLPGALRDAVAGFDLTAGTVEDVIRRAERRSRRRRRVGTTVLSVLVLAGAAGAVRLASRDTGSALPVAGPGPSDPTTTSTSLPPPRADVTQLADPSPTPNEFPISIEQYNEGVGARLRHRSGGPYLSEADVRDRVLKLQRCGETPDSRCDGAAVRLFGSYAAAYRDYGPPVWQYMGNFGHDREVYLVTVYGALPFYPHGPSILASGRHYRDHQNYVIDATTGEPS
jgi:hypothetical protein